MVGRGGGREGGGGLWHGENEAPITTLVRCTCAVKHALQRPVLMSQSFSIPSGAADIAPVQEGPVQQGYE